ncbi:uncharacterized protein BBA_10276 [Beauveria bassiana ARSEF 2860]|uniref:Uncharacterized protein n=1 Tax=Beauveria bassiana (strain ARSEF 2860) TaxID=655819 RepID=J5J1J9_BEAB2|nr:uncharacterized protein BBA_10276 [Beauveria bassiana ARSEF 2860]EJP60773.1 hypothetical protein BBA_10276 [Beauveria bassiana ARSEF 2860]
MTAPWNGHKDIVDLLIHRGADVNHRTSSSAGPIGSRRTALALVIEKHRPRNVGILRQQDDHLASVAKLLLEQDGIDLTDGVNGIPMLKMAIGKVVVAVVDQLLDAYELDEDEREYTIEIGLEAFLERWKRARRQYEKHGEIEC